MPKSEAIYSVHALVSSCNYNINSYIKRKVTEVSIVGDGPLVICNIVIFVDTILENKISSLV